MSENCELRRGLRRREKNATDEGAGHFEKPAPDARAAPPEAHESLISRDTVAEVLLTGLFFHVRQPSVVKRLHKCRWPSYLHRACVRTVKVRAAANFFHRSHRQKPEL